jgi:hypothetical protein
MPRTIEPGNWDAAFVFNEKMIIAIVKESMSYDEKLVKVHFDRKAPGKPWEEYGTAFAVRYIEAEIDGPAFDQDAVPAIERTVYTMRGYVGLSLNGLSSPADKREYPREWEAGIEALPTVQWL